MSDAPCSKCNSRNILKIPGKVDSYGSGNNIMWGILSRNVVLVTIYLCCECGILKNGLITKKI